MSCQQAVYNVLVLRLWGTRCHRLVVCVFLAHTQELAVRVHASLLSFGLKAGGGCDMWMCMCSINLLEPFGCVV